MQDPFIIKGSLTPVGGQSQKNIYGQTVEHRSDSKITNLRVGELVQGTIIQFESDNSDEALVRLPIGTYPAKLNGKLQQGDTLFFRVEEVNPQLILKIFSVSALNDGLELGSKEIIRLLNLPQSGFFHAAVNFLKKKKNTVVKDVILQLYKSFSELTPSDLKEMNLEDILKILQSIHDLDLPFSPEIFSKLKEALLGSGYFSLVFYSFISNLLYLPKEEQQRLITIFQKIQNNNIVELLKFFTFSNPEESPDNENLYEFLKYLVNKYQYSDNVELLNLLGTSKSLMQTIESYYFLNLLALQNNAPLFITLPFQKNSSYKIIRLILQKTVSAGKVIEFTLIIDTDNLGEITANGSYYYDRLNTMILTEKQEFTDFINEHLKELETVLKEQDYIIGSLKAGNIKDFRFMKHSETENIKNVNLSVVV